MTQEEARGFQKVNEFHGQRFSITLGEEQLMNI